MSVAADAAAATVTAIHNKAERAPDMLTDYAFTPGGYSVEGMVARFHLQPVWIAAITAVLLPAALCGWCWRNGTLRIRPTADNPDGHGLVSWINMYLIFTVPLNYAIFSYYETYPREVNRLYASGILRGSADTDFHLATGALATGLTIFAYVVAAALAVLSYFWNSWPKPKRITNWLAERGKPRPVSAYFHVTFFAVELAIVFNWAMHHFLIWWGLSGALQGAALQAYDPDGMFGLGPLSVLVWWSFIAISIVAFLVAVWLLGSALTLAKEPFLGNPGHAASIIALAALAPFIVFAPLVTAHQAMERTRALTLAALARTIEAHTQHVLDLARAATDAKPLEGTTAALEAERKIYAGVRDSSTWPISGGMFGAFPFGFLSPVFVALAGDLGKRAKKHLKLERRLDRLLS
jgi:hypothetical protein